MAKKIFSQLLILVISIALSASLPKNRFVKVFAKPQPAEDTLTKFIGGYDLNAVVNGLINSKQDMLQQLRPVVQHSRPVTGHSPTTTQIVTLTGGAFGAMAPTGTGTTATGEGPIFITLAGGETTVNGQGIHGTNGRPTSPVQVIGTTGAGTGGVGIGGAIQVINRRPGGGNTINRRPHGPGSVFVVQIP